MTDYRLGEVETHFAELIWQKEPISSGELVKLAESALCWKKSTTYTVLRRLCEKELFQNEKGIVTSRVSKEDFYAMQSERFVEETFSGSLPAFLAAFSSRKKLSEQELRELQSLIDRQKEG